MSSKEPHTPYIPASKVLPEITGASIALAVVLAVVLGAANAYLGLVAGMTVSASIPAAVIAMAALKFLGGNILQSNNVQTAASAGESLAAGAIFTFPALIFLGVWEGFSYFETTVLAGLGGLLGVLFTIPLRRAMIVDQPLQFPEGVATAEVLKVGEEGGSSVRPVIVAAIIGALFKFGESGAYLWKGAAHISSSLGGKAAVVIGSDLKPALIAVGYIVGLNIAVLVFLGGASNWLIAIPIYSWGEMPAGSEVADVAGGIWSAHTRYLGVGAMLVGGVWALIRLAPSLVRGIRSSLVAYRNLNKDGASLPRTEQDTPMNFVFVAAGLALIPLFLVSHHFTGSLGTALIMAAFMLIAGFLFSAVAAYMAGLVGSSNNPISGVTIATVLSASLILVALGMDSSVGPAAAIFIGAVVCCAAAIGGDNMQDLKAGHLLGSTPKRQQLMQVVGVVSAVLVMAPVLNLLHDAYVIGPEGGLQAPQASLMQAVAAGVFENNLPWGMTGLGAALAVFVIACDLLLESRGSSFRMPVLAYAVGIYLPMELSTPIFIGGLIAYFAKRSLSKGGANPEAGLRKGMLFAAGLITGEALLGILLAIPIAIAADKTVLRFFDGYEPGVLPGIVLLAGTCVLLYRTALKRD